MKELKPYDLNLVGMNNHAKIIAEQEKKFHEKQKTMSKEYLGSQEAFEDSINEHYDAIEERNKKQEREIEQQIDGQIRAYEYLNMLIDANFEKHFVDVFTTSNNEGKYVLTREELLEVLDKILKN